MRIFAYLIITLLFMNVSCKTKQKTTLKKESTSITSPKKTEKTPLFTKLLAGGHSNMQKRQLLLINNNDDLKQLFTTLNSTRKPGFEIPTIDFNKNSVVGLFMGSKNSGGYSITIDYVDYADKETVVYFTEKRPSGRAISVMTQPFYLAKIAKSTNPVRFEQVKD